MAILGMCFVIMWSIVGSLYLMEEGRDALLATDARARKALVEVATSTSPTLANVGHLLVNAAITLPLFIVEDWDIAALIHRAHTVQGSEALWLDGVSAQCRCASHGTRPSTPLPAQLW